MTHDPHLVGRDHILEAAADLLAQQGRAGARCLLLVGEPGVGRTATLDQILETAEATGWHVRSATAAGADLLDPFSTLRYILSDEGQGGQHRARFDLDSRDGALGPVAAASAAVSRLIDRAPTVLAIDDAHRLDPDSVGVLTALVRRLVGAPLLLILSSRSGEPTTARQLVDTRLILAPDGQLVEQHLAPLNRDQVMQVMTHTTGREGTKDEVDRCLSATNGIPFYLHQYLSAEEGATAPTDTSVMHRMLPTDREARTLLRVLAVFDHVHLDDLGFIAELLGSDTADLDSAFDGLVRASLVRPAGETFVLTHQLMRDWLLDDLGPAEARSLHRRIADHLLQRRRDGAPVEIDRIALHLDECAAPGDLAAARLLAAAAAFRERLTPALALRWYDRATGLLPPSRDEWGMWTTRRLSLMRRLGRNDEAIDVGESALVSISDDDRRRDDIALVVASCLNSRGEPARALRLLEREIGADTSSLAALNLLSTIFRNLGQMRRAEEHNERAVDLATDTSGHALIAHAERAHVLLGQGRYLQARQVLKGLAGRFTRADPADRPMALALVAHALTALSSAGAADHALREAKQLMVDDDAQLRHWIIAGDIAVAGHSGQWETALELSDDLLMSTGLDRSLAAHMRCVRADILGARGDAQALQEVALADVQPIRRRAAYSRLGIAIALGAANAETVALFQRSALWSPDTERSRGMWVTDRHVELALELGARDHAERLLTEMADTRGDSLREYWKTIATARFERNVDAARHAHATVQGTTRLNKFESAKIALLLGQLGDDPELHLAAAVEAFRDLGADPWRLRAVKELRDRGLKVPRRKRRKPGSLSEAEVAMAKLVSRGLTNAQIGQELAYSAGTVSVYLSKIYAKLEVGNRVELARLVEEGLIED